MFLNIKSMNLTGNWIETSVKYDKVMEDGLMKSVTEKYLVNALSFTEAEVKIIEEMKVYISGEFLVSAVRQCRYGVVLMNGEDGDLWYKVKMSVITIDEKTDREKRQTVNYLVQAKTVRHALDLIEEYMRQSMIDHEVETVALTKIIDVFANDHEESV